jgi:hypothetical protein
MASIVAAEALGCKGKLVFAEVARAVAEWRSAFSLFCGGFSVFLIRL